MSAFPLRNILALSVVLLVSVPTAAAHGSTPLGNALLGPIHGPTPNKVAKHAFAFVSNFEDKKLDGWKVVNGTASVVTNPNYEGEPSLRSVPNGSVPQYDLARAGFVRGAHALSIEVAIDASGGTGYFGLTGPSGPVATIGIRNLSIVAGTSPATSTTIATVPTGTSQPSGWVELIGSIYHVGSGASTKYYLAVYADRTDSAIITSVRVPNATSYVGAFIETVSGTVEYSDIFVTTYQIPSTIPHFNPMEGYGQGSGTLVQVLPAFTSLTATETLGNWTTPEASILSFQINAMNYTGTDKSTCSGFFQLGVDLEPGGYIAPWYVPGHACRPYYFGHRASWAGFRSPNGTVLTLTIRDNISGHAIDFSLIDGSVKGANRNWTTSIPYSGTKFFGSYTQLEFQPTSLYPIDHYFLNGSIDGLTMSGGNLTKATPFAADYMVPFEINVPPTWNMNYYQVAASGYTQKG